MNKLLRSFLDRQGYVLWKREFFRPGISPFVDVAKLNAAWGRSLDVLFDVGANVGQFAGEARQELPDAKIYSFEPHPRSFEKLSRSRSDELMFRHCLALGEKIGEVPFYEYASEGDASHRNSLIPDAQSAVRFGYEGSEIRVKSTTLDHFCATQSVNRIDFLKIDVEGADLSVLKGGSDLLAHKRIMAVYFEFNSLDTITEESGGALMPIARYLANFGLQYACTYTDSMLHQNELAPVANAMFVLPPN